MFEVARANRPCIIFLDEVDALPWGMQTKLLRFLQMQEFYRVGGKKLIRVDVRIIAASNQDLETLVVQQRFRPDFYYRLNVLQIVIPPLRGRREDIVPLAHISLDRFNALHRTEKFISPAIYQYLLAYDWPGNIRELENIIERMVVEHGGDLLTPEALPKKVKQALGEPGRHVDSASDYRWERDNFEKSFWSGIFSRFRTMREAARATGVAHSTVVKKFSRYNIRGASSSPKTMTPEFLK
jgi:transcriptional regulator with PAS, ATPase and Fis domain